MRYPTAAAAAGIGNAIEITAEDTVVIGNGITGMQANKHFNRQRTCCSYLRQCHHYKMQRWSCRQYSLGSGDGNLGTAASIMMGNGVGAAGMTGSVVMGNDATAEATSGSVAIGNSVNVGANVGGVVIGNGATADGGKNQVVIGNGVVSIANQTVVIGDTARTSKSATGSIAIGSHTLLLLKMYW